MSDEATYMIVRRFFKQESQVIRRGLSLEEAQEHCADPETSSRTCVQIENVQRTLTYGPWFDSYTEE